jgi:YVTN family beta-propeller protein
MMLRDETGHPTSLGMRRAAVAIAACAMLAAAPHAADRPAGTIVTSNMNDNTASVIDAASGRVLATLPTGTGPHEVAISHDGRWAAVSNYGSRQAPGNSITIIDVARHTVARTLDLGEHRRPHGMAFLPGDSLLAVTSEVSQAILIVNARNGAIVRVRPTGGRLTHMLAVSADGQRMVTANIGSGTISVLRPLGAESATTIGVAAAPEGIAIAPDGHTAWAGSDRDSVVVVVDLDRAQPIDTLRGFGLPYRLAVTPDGRKTVITDPVRAEVRIVDAATRRALATLHIASDSLVSTAEIPGSPSPEGVTISRDSRWAFVTLQGENRVITIDLEAARIVSSAPTGTWSDGVGFSIVTSATGE